MTQQQKMANNIILKCTGPVTEAFTIPDNFIKSVNCIGFVGFDVLTLVTIKHIIFTHILLLFGL
jgi:hypothetical protein